MLLRKIDERINKTKIRAKIKPLSDKPLVSQAPKPRLTSDPVQVKPVTNTQDIQVPKGYY